MKACERVDEFLAVFAEFCLTFEVIEEWCREVGESMRGAQNVAADGAG